MPEPTTMALMGTGVLGLTVRYLRLKYRAAKPWVDWTLALVLLVLLSPVILACVLLVKLTSRGPAFYLQERVGKDGRPFLIYKLRTMRGNAEEESGPVWAEGGSDPRLTVVGGFLRRTHLDELPQLVNVLRGEMSLVGPRPERPHFVEQFRREVPGYERRLDIKPGITGLAQIRAGYDRSVRDVRRKVKLDRMYIRRMCWWVDFLILVGTFGKILFDQSERGGRVSKERTVQV